MTVGDRRYAARVMTARDDAKKNGHKWWPVSKRSLQDHPTDADRAAVKRPSQVDNPPDSV